MVALRTRARRLLWRLGANHHHNAELARLTSAPWQDHDAMDALRLARLAATVRAAAKWSPFYRHVLGSNCKVPHSFDELATLPVTSKNDMRGLGLDRARPGSLVRRRNVGRTSGSSGEPYTFELDLWYGDRHAAQRAYVYLAAGLARGGRLVEITDGSEHIESDPTYPTFDRFAVGDACGDMSEAVLAARPGLLYGRRSLLLQIADTVETSATPFSVPLIGSSSETLHEQDRLRLETVLGGHVLEVYGLREAGNLAFRLPDNPKWKILEPRVIVEVLDDQQRRVQPGEIGQLVVTTLTEKTSPLIRYATGDLARVESGSADGASGLVLAALEGRSADAVVAADGRSVSFWDIAQASFWTSERAAGVRRWQVHQRADRSILASVELMRGATLDSVEGAIVNHIRSGLGPVPIEVVATDRLHDPTQGKFRAVTSDAVPAIKGWPEQQ